MMRIVSVDPGLNGAIACLNGTLRSVTRMPTHASEIDVGAVVTMLNRIHPEQVVIEEQQSMPKQGVSSTFRTGLNFGMLIGAIETLGYPLVRMRAVEWKRLNGLMGKSKDDSRRLASELWPAHRDSFKLIKDDGMAEAALIGRAFQIKFIREENAS